MHHFIPVQVNNRLSFDFDDAGDFEIHHYAFKVDESEFDAIFSRLEEEKITYGSGPFSAENMQINRLRGGRGGYFHDPDGHLLEILTV